VNHGNKNSKGKRRFKLEARNPKFETNTNDPNSNGFSLFAVFEPLNFEIVSDLDIRISDFLIFKN
jgi:hypothetical protein